MGISIRFSTWLYELCRGRDYQAVSVRSLVKSIACSKNFFGKSALIKDDEIFQWMINLASEIVERVAIDRANHSRLPTNLSIFLRSDKTDLRSKTLNPGILASIPPRSQQINEEAESQIARRIAEMAHGAVRGLVGTAPITNISLSVGKFISDHSVACGDVKKLLTEPPKRLKRESFFRKLIEDRKDEDQSTPKVAREVSPRVADNGTQEETSTSNELIYFQRHSPTAEKVLCADCGSYVLMHLMPEHQDFHFARKVQQEWNREVNKVPQIPHTKKEVKLDREVKGARGKRKKELGLTKIDNYFFKND
ncbi:unnamed protein product [Hydatigera taeniaeformis]|uniref:Zf_UBZ domain-containing protein n=1 Tax=Hydatigena taeniaeformis TaxID=6205 RepID=A0A0R3WSU3_HYDTA|nr:unnamed protein product [Hydatigera taeniaeformis]